MSAMVGTLHKMLLLRQNELEEYKKSLLTSKKNICTKIQSLRKEINERFTVLQTNTMKEIDNLLAALFPNIINAINKCTSAIKDMNHLQEDIKQINVKKETRNVLMYDKCNKAELFLQEISSYTEVAFTFNLDTSLQQTLTAMTRLGVIHCNEQQPQTFIGSLVPEYYKEKVISHAKPVSIHPSLVSSSLSDQTPAISIPKLVPNSNCNQDIHKGIRTRLTVKLKSDTCSNSISGICVTASGDLLISDCLNKRVKLLDKTNMVVAQYDLPDKLLSMCSIDSSMVAVLMGINEVHIIRVTDGQLVKERTLKLQHSCIGIAHHQGNLYITSGTALYHYRLDGRLLSKMYEDAPNTWTVTSLAVNPDGDNKTLELSQEEIFRTLFKKVNIDARAECKADSFTAFSHGRAALQGIVTKGKDILDWHLFSATENQMMNCECIQLYANASLLKKIEAYSPEIISTIDYKQSRQDILFPAIVIVKEKHQYMIEDWISNIRKNITGLCVVVVCKGNIFNFDRSPQNNIFLTNANRWEVMMAAQKLLERAIYRVLKHLVKTLMQKYGTSTDLTDLEKESTLQSVYAYSRAAYQRSKLPECERLNIPAITYTYPENINDVIKTLLRIQGVVGCSKKFGILEVSVDSKQDKDKTTDQVKQLLMKEKIGATFEYGSFSHFLSPGDPVYAGEGTLGGFAQRFPKTRYNSIAADRMSSLKSPGTKGKLVALISRHVAQAFTPTENASLYIGNNIVGQIHKIPHKGILDIVPFDIHEHFIKECNTRFQTEAKKQMHGQLPENNDCLIGLPVFLWGAKSAPGLGMLDSIMDMQDAGGVQCIKIHNRIPDKPFSEPGDSGAIVCSTDSEASTLTTIAMLIGQFQNSKQPTYFAILLKEAFAELNEFYESEFKMCEDAAATP